MNALILSLKNRTVTETAEIMALQAEVLARSQAVVRVTTPEEQDKAVEAQASLARYIRAVDSSAEAAKKPINEIRKKIIDWNKAMVELADTEGNRLAAMCNEFQLAEQRRVTAAKIAQDETVLPLERECNAKVAAAQTVDEQEAIREEYREKIADAAPPVPEVYRSKGQQIRYTWEIQVRDIHTLYRNHPHCVKLTELKSEITMLLEQGVIVKGVTAKKIFNSGVRLTKDLPAIEVETNQNKNEEKSQ